MKVLYVQDGVEANERNRMTSTKDYDIFVILAPKTGGGI